MLVKLKVLGKCVICCRVLLISMRLINWLLFSRFRCIEVLKVEFRLFRKVVWLMLVCCCFLFCLKGVRLMLKMVLISIWLLVLVMWLVWLVSSLLCVLVLLISELWFIVGNWW